MTDELERLFVDLYHSYLDRIAGILAPLSNDELEALHDALLPANLRDRHPHLYGIAPRIRSACVKTLKTRKEAAA